MGEDYRTVQVLAGRLGVDHRVLRRLIKSGKLRAYKIGRALRVHEGDLESLVVQVAAPELKRERREDG
jgi:excisionase family DNA binding protein